MPRSSNKASPPILTPPLGPRGSTVRGKALAVVVSVDDPTSPTFATVAVNDHFPFESGFAIPMGAGPFTEGTGIGGNLPVNANSTTAVTSTGFPVTITVDSSGTSMQGITSGNVNTFTTLSFASGTRTVTPVSMTDIGKYQELIIGSGADQETVTVTATTGTTFTANFVNAHGSNEPCVSAGNIILYDTGGAHPEAVNVSSCTYGGANPPFTGGTFQATFTYTHTEPAAISNNSSSGLGYFYFYNNSDGVGGSICWVDLDTKQILSFTGRVSTIAPSPYYQTILTHRHNGNYDPIGYQNPGPINISYPETIGNLPYWQNTLVLQGVVDSDGNVIAVDFNPGMLKRISPSYAQNVLMNNALAGLYEAINWPVEDNVAFLLESGQWLWVEWQATFNTQPTAYCGPTFQDVNGNIIQVRFEPPGGGQGPVYTKFPSTIAAGTRTITPTAGSAMTNITSGSSLTVGTGTALEVISVTSTTGTTFTATFLLGHNAKDPIVAQGYGHLYCGNNSGTTQVTSSIFRVPISVLGTTEYLGQDLFSNFATLHWIEIGLQCVGGTQYRVLVRYSPNVACDTAVLLDITFDTNTYTSGGMIPPILPGYTSDDLTDMKNVFFKKYEYRTTSPGQGNQGNPYPNNPPVELTGFTNLFYYSQAAGSPSFDTYCEFDVTSYGHIPRMSDWNGQIVLLASQTGNSNWGQYGFIQPTDVGTAYNSTGGTNATWWTNLGVGSEWDLAIAYIDQVGNMTPPLVLGTVTPPNGIGIPAPIINPALNTPVVTTSSATIDPSPPGDLNSDVSVSITLTTAPPFTQDYTKLAFSDRQDGRSKPWTAAGEVDLVGNGTGFNGMTGATAWTTGPYVYNYVQLANGLTYDFAINFSGASGYGPFATPAAIQGIVNNPIFVHGRYMDHGAAVAAPIFSSTPTIGNTISDNTLFDAVDIQFSTNNQPTDGSLGSVGVIASSFNFKTDGYADSSAAYVKPSFQAIVASSHAGGNPPVGATGNYDITINDLNNGSWYAFWATYINNNGKSTILPPVFTYGYGNAGFSTGITSSATSFYFNGNSGGYSNNGVSANVVAGTILIVDPNGTNPETVVVAGSYAGGGANPIPIVGSFAHNHNANGVPVIIGSGYLGSLEAQNITIPPGSFPTMPVGIGITPSAFSGFSYSGGQLGSYHAQFTVTPVLTGLGGSPFSAWGQGFACFVIINNDSSDHVQGTEYDSPLSAYSLSSTVSTGASWTTGTSISFTTDGLSVQNNYQVAIVAIDQQGNYSGSPNFNPPSGGGGAGSTGGICVIGPTTQSQYNPQDAPNLIPDSSMECVQYRLNYPGNTWVDGFYNNTWANRQIFYASYHVKNSYYNDPSDYAHYLKDTSDEGGNAFVVDPNSDNQQNVQLMGEPMQLVGGTTYCLSCYIDATGCNAGAHSGNPPSIALISHVYPGTTLTSTASAGTNTLHVTSATGFLVNDFITIYDPQTPDNSEAQKINTVVGTTITLVKNLIFTHTTSKTQIFINWNPASPNQSQVLIEQAATFGDKGRVSLIFTPTGNQIASALFQSHKCNVTGTSLKFVGPMCQEGDYPGPYKPGPKLKK